MRPMFNDHIAHTGAVIASIWDRDVDTLSTIVDRHEIDIEFGEAATPGIVESLMEKTAERTSLPVSRAAFRIPPMLDVLRRLTPVKMALLIGFRGGVICLLTRQRRPRRDLEQWWVRLEMECVWARQEVWTMHFLWYHNRPNSREYFSFFESLDSIRDDLALRYPESNNDMPGGTRFLEHTVG